MPINDSNNTDDFDNTIVCITGATDQTKIGNEGDSLKVTTTGVDSGDFETFKSETEVVLSSDTIYDTLHSVIGEGFVIGATFVVDSDQVECRILIDGNPVFEFTGMFLSEVVNKDADFSAAGLFGSTNDGKRLYFTPPMAFKYNTSLEFQARKDGKKVKYQLYTYSEL